MIEAYFGEGEFSVTGHAGYAPHGRDIVCAGVSALCAALINYLDRLDEKGFISMYGLELGDGFLRCGVDNDFLGFGREAIKLVRGGIELVAKAYPKNVCVRTLPRVPIRK